MRRHVNLGKMVEKEIGIHFVDSCLNCVTVLSFDVNAMKVQAGGAATKYRLFYLSR